jgi:hypothetical protein
MAVEVKRDNSNKPFILYSGPAARKTNAVIKQDAARSTDLAQYTVLGRIPVTVPTTGTADGGNTGDGTVTAVSAAKGSPSAQVGAYNLECTFAVTNGGVFKLEDPAGNIVADNLTLRVGAGFATAFSEAGLEFTITDGATDFIAGDKFSITTTADGDYYPLDPEATNGLEKVAAIFSGCDIASADIVAGDVTGQSILVGNFFMDQNQLVLENSATLATVLPSGYTVEEELQRLNIYSEDTVVISGAENA